MSGVDPTSGALGAHRAHHGKHVDNKGTFDNAVSQMLGPMLNKGKHAAVNAQAGIEAGKKVQNELSQLIEDLLKLMNPPVTAAKAKKLLTDLKKLQKLSHEHFGGKGLDPKVEKAIQKTVQSFVTKITNLFESAPGMGGAISKFLDGKESLTDASKAVAAGVNAERNSKTGFYSSGMNAIVDGLNNTATDLTSLSTKQNAELNLLMGILTSLLQSAGKITQKQFQTEQTMARNISQ